jgi:hypothetical protein
MLKKTAIISLIFFLLSGMAGLKELSAQDICPGKCCCVVPGAASHPGTDLKNLSSLTPTCGCCQKEGLVACRDSQKPAAAAQEMAFSQELNEKAPAPAFIFALTVRVADAVYRSAVIGEPDHVFGKYQLLPIYLCNLSLLI